VPGPSSGRCPPGRAEPVAGILAEDGIHVAGRLSRLGEEGGARARAVCISTGESRPAWRRCGPRSPGPSGEWSARPRSRTRALMRERRQPSRRPPVGPRPGLGHGLCRSAALPPPGLVDEEPRPRRGCAAGWAWLLTRGLAAGTRRASDPPLAGGAERAWTLGLDHRADAARDQVGRTRSPARRSGARSRWRAGHAVGEGPGERSPRWLATMASGSSRSSARRRIGSRTRRGAMNAGPDGTTPSGLRGWGRPWGAGLGCRLVGGEPAHQLLHLPRGENAAR